MAPVTRSDRLLRVVAELASARDVPTVTTIVRTAARALTHADGVTFVIREGGECYYADEDAIAPLWKGKRLPMHQCVSGWVMRTGQPVVIPDIYADSRVPHDAYRPTFVRSMAMVPVRPDNPVGAIGAYWASEHTASPQELQTLSTLADSASVALANVAVYDELNRALVRERQAREAAEAGTAAKDEFLAMVSHELRQPLQAILAGVQVMALRSSRDHGVHAREIVARQAQHMVRILEDLLESSRIVRGAVAIKPEMVDLRDVVREAIEVAGAGNGPRRDIDLVLPSVPVLLNVDAARFRQVIQNLLANAIKFTQRNETIAVTIETTDCDVAVHVRDAGMGIDPTMLPHIFDLFTKGDHREGFGIGLAVVQRLVELHGGTVEARSAGRGSGSEFIVRLPMNAAAAQ
jgi:signal transduction histidine kinase